MPVEPTSPQTAAIAAYTQTEAATHSSGRTRQPRPVADPANANSNPHQDQVTLSAQALQAHTQSNNNQQVNQAAATENAGKDSLQRGRENVAAGSKSIAQALTAYHQAALV